MNMSYVTAGLTKVVTPYLDGTCDIYRRARVKDETGGTAWGYPSTPDVAGVACQLRPVNLHAPKVEVVGSQSQSLVLWLLRLLPDQHIAPTDKVVKDGVAFAVTGEYGMPQSDGVNTLAYLVEFKTT